MIDARVMMGIRGSAQPNFAEGDEHQPLLTNLGHQLVAQGVPNLTAITGRGNSYWARTATAAAPVTAIPTTAALIGLYNGEPDNGKSYIIDSVFVIQTAVTGAVHNVGILANISTAQITTAIANTIAPRCLRAGAAYRGNARVAVGITLNADDGVAANWMPIGSTGPAQNTLQIGTVVDVDVKGGIIIPPKGQLSLSALAGAATATSIQIGVRWHEVILPPVV
jgi:hypothetical protein